MKKPALVLLRAGTDTQRFALSLTAAAALAALATTAVAQEAAKTEAQQLDTVTVTGVKASLTKSLAVKRTSDQVVESVVAEDIGKLPDNNVVEALQRVTGIQVTNRAGGEVGTLSIRGMPDVETTWNGRNIFTASGTQVALQDIPSTLVRQIDVYKTRDASQLETGIAGQIDVKSLRPFDFKGAKFSLSARDTYLDPAKKSNPQLSAMASDRWQTGIGEVGALVNLSMTRTNYRNESVTPGAMVPFASPNAGEDPAGYTPLQRIFDTAVWTPGTHAGLPEAAGSTLNFNGKAYPYYLSRDAIFQSDVQGRRERPAANLALQWKPNEDAVYTFESMYNGYRDKTFNQLLFSFVDWWGNLGSNPAGSITTYPGTNIIKTRTVGSVYGFNSGDYTTSATDSYIYALNGKWNLGDRLRLDGDLSYQTSKYHSEFTATRIDRVADAINVDFNSGGGNMSFHFNDDAKLTDPTQWNVAQFYDNANRNEGSAGTASLSGSYDADWGAVKTLHFGLRYDDRKASEANRTQSAYLGKNLATLGSNYYWTNSGFGTDISSVPRTWMEPHAYYIRDHIDDWRKLYHAADANFLTTDQLHLQKTFDVDEKTSNLYLMADTENELLGHTLKGNFGLRYTNVGTDMTFYKVDATTKAVTPSSASKSTGKFLPSLTLRYDPAKDVLLRFNYGETLRRPNFGDLNPVLQLGDDVSKVGYGSGGGGNPDLKPTRSKNLDLTAEWYFQKDSALYGTAFTRRIEGLVVGLRHKVHVDRANDPFANSTSGGDHSNGYDYVINSPVNASNGRISGFELGTVYFPKGLPWILDGLGFQGSYTQLSSSQNVPDANDAGVIVAQLKTPFFGVSNRSYNATLAYEKGPVGARLSYVWRSGFLAGNEAALFANPIGIWRHPEHSLDFQLTYNINDRMSFDVSGVNLTNEKQQQYYHFGDAGSAQTTNFGTVQIGRSFSAGFRWKL
ncbi:TonB-dependent receptor [Pelomonas aquatica]|jgi:TonB-dependent receptor|uniref:TonB-dependent receptor n=1 Tax=Pelomonas aquatica TaxID=431058 RepID=A0A9X4LGW6_9BURK|nr:TonB-dependent receptor [Pelomonas aquatica]MCY4753190.1 TonB-dependent receptor [Pelomonas aquatica]MDG0862746.1 TonB-dependent receptor [Pelomonas aquatica]